jgi:hypothetical protein
LGRGVWLKVSPPPHKIFVKGYPPPNAIFSEIFLNLLKFPQICSKIFKFFFDPSPA